jgi:hypothetical protein
MMFCMIALMFCANLTAEPTLVITNDTEPLCLQDVRGCAILENNTIVLKEDRLDRRTATLYHEMLHLELGAEHSREMIRRDNEFRDYIGVYDRYIYG